MGADSAEPLRRATVLRSGGVDPDLQNRQPKSLPSALFQRGGHHRCSGWIERHYTLTWPLSLLSGRAAAHQAKTKEQVKIEKETHTHA